MIFLILSRVELFFNFFLRYQKGKQGEQSDKHKIG